MFDFQIPPVLRIYFVVMDSDSSDDFVSQPPMLQSTFQFQDNRACSARRNVPQLGASHLSLAEITDDATNVNDVACNVSL